MSVINLNLNNSSYGNSKNLLSNGELKNKKYLVNNNTIVKSDKK